MKKTTTLSALVITIVCLLSFNLPNVSSIKGKVSPSQYGIKAWAISDKDTLYTTIEDGNFEFYGAAPGVYRIVVEALSPYRHMAKDGIEVQSGQITDIGQLSLQKYTAVIR